MVFVNIYLYVRGQNYDSDDIKIAIYGHTNTNKKDERF